MKTIKVRIAVAINHEGQWNAYGYSAAGDESWSDLMDAFETLEGETRGYFVTAEIPVPDPMPAEIMGQLETS